jgi:hypothetical protein
MVRVHLGPPFIRLIGFGALTTRIFLVEKMNCIWGISSAGRAPALHAGGQRFDPVILHHLFKSSLFIF